MTDCHQIDSLVTRYVDGDLAVTEREVIDAHLQECGLCRGRVRAEQAVRVLMQTRGAALAVGATPPGLRTRCAALGRSAVAPTSWIGKWRARAVPVALVSSLALIAGGAFLYELTDRSTRVMAAELTADHLKCFRVINNVLGTQHEPAAVESSMASRFAWQMRLPEHPEQAGLELVGARPCLYAEGLVAHIMYRHNGHPVSIFMLPKKARAREQIEIMGHQAAIWSVGNRTFVLIAREPRAEIERMTAFVYRAMQ